jgi:hypothetical protein
MAKITELDVASLAAYASALRGRALLGDRDARAIANQLDAELSRRLGEAVMPPLVPGEPKARRSGPRRGWTRWWTAPPSQ